MKKFGDLIMEVVLSKTRSKQHGIEFAIGVEHVSKLRPHEQNYEHISTTSSGHRVLHRNGTYLFHHPKTNNVDVRVSSHKRGLGKNVEGIDTVSSRSGSPLKAHDAYHHLIIHHNKILVADHHTTGGKHIWKHLASKPGVSVHGWDDQKNEPVNVTPKSGSGDRKRIYDTQQNHKRRRRLPFAHRLVAHKTLDEVTDYDGIISKKQGKGAMAKHAHLTGKFRYNPKKDQSDEIGANYKKIGVHPKTGHHIYHYKEGNYEEHHFHDPHHPGKIDLAIATTSKHHKNGTSTHNVESVASRDGASIKAHEAYHHLMGPKHRMIFTSKAQTAGGQHIWQKLSKMRGVKMHAYDKEGGVQNLHPVHDREEVYQSHEHGQDRGSASVPSHIVAYRD